MTANAPMAPLQGFDMSRISEERVRAMTAMMQKTTDVVLSRRQKEAEKLEQVSREVAYLRGELSRTKDELAASRIEADELRRVNVAITGEFHSYYQRFTGLMASIEEHHREVVPANDRAEGLFLNLEASAALNQPAPNTSTERLESFRNLLDGFSTASPRAVPTASF